MAFFGLTALGPQNNFQSNLAATMMLASFTEEEYSAAFSKVDVDKSGNINYSELGKLLEVVYMGPVPQAEVTKAMVFFDRNHDEVISRVEFEEGIKELRARSVADAEAARTKATTFKSAEQLKTDRRRHKRVVDGPVITQAKVR